MSQNTEFEARAEEAGVRRIPRTKKLTRQKLDRVQLPAFLLQHGGAEPRHSRLFSFTHSLAHPA